MPRRASISPSPKGAGTTWKFLALATGVIPSRMRRGQLDKRQTSEGFGTVSYTHLTLPTICSV